MSEPFSDPFASKAQPDTGLFDDLPPDLPEVKGFRLDDLPGDPFGDSDFYPSAQMPERAALPEPRKRRARLLGAFAATAAIAATGAFVLRGGNSGESAASETSVAETVVSESPLETAPIESMPPVTIAAPTTEAAVPVEAVSPFERTGAPEQDALLSWFEQADLSAAVDVRAEEFVQPRAETGMFGMIDENEAAKEAFGAQFEFAFQHTSGLQVNVYKGNINGLPDVQLDPKALAITMDFVHAQTRQANSGYLNEQEVGLIETANQTGVLAGRGVNFIFIDRNSDDAIDKCLEEIDQKYIDSDPTKCEVAGTTSVIIGGTVSESTTIVVQLPPYYPEMQIPKQVETARQQIDTARTVAHEYAHALVEFSGASDRYETPARERAKAEATSPEGIIDHEQYSKLFSEYLTPAVTAEHTGYVERVGDIMTEVSNFNNDEVFYTQAVPGVSDAVVVDRALPGAWIITTGRMPFTDPPVRINS